MADSLTSRFSLEEVRASVKRMQAEGERLVGQIRRGAGDLVAGTRRPAVFETLSDARRRATQAVQDLDVRPERLRSLVTEQLGALNGTLTERIGVAKAQEVTELGRRVADIEHRLDRLAKDQAA